MPNPDISVSLQRPAIYINGTHVQSLTEDLLELICEESVSTSAWCKASFLNIKAGTRQGVSYKYFDLHQFKFGDNLTVWMGVPPSTLYALFRGHINVIDGNFQEKSRPEILLHAEDAFRDLRAKQRTRFFEQVTDVDIIQQIASEYNLSVDIQIQSNAPLHQYVAQLNQSDFAFLFERVRLIGSDMWLDGNQLIVRQVADQDADPVDLVFGEELLDFKVSADLRNQCTSMGVAGWDIKNKEEIRQSASDNDLSDLPASAKTGGRVLEEAFGQKLHTNIDSMPVTPEIAETMAQSFYREKSESFIIGKGVAKPSPALRVGRRLFIRNVGMLFGGAYTVVRVRHVFNQVQGLRTEFEVRRAYIGVTEKKLYSKHKPKEDANAGTCR